MRDLAYISAASKNNKQRHAYTSHPPTPITLEELSVQTMRVLAPIYKAHQPLRVDTNVPRMQKSIKLTQSPRVEQIIITTESLRVNHPSPPIFDPSPLAVPSVQPISS